VRVIVVLSKAPLPGKAKTRMSPPLTLEEAALVARLALADTFQVAGSCSADRHVAVFDGDPVGWVPDGWDVVGQRDGGLDSRLADAFDDVFSLVGPGHLVVLIAMDTPQVDVVDLDSAFDALEAGADSVLGFTDDGGYWTIGLRVPDRRIFEGVPMSTDHTGADQLARLHSLGHHLSLLPSFRDLDSVEDVVLVAQSHPHLQISSWWNTRAR
jgi:rSAM/selenodomain-associated transferase 1